MWFPIEAPEGYEAELTNSVVEPKHWKLWCKKTDEDLWVFVGHIQPNQYSSVATLIEAAEKLANHPKRGILAYCKYVKTWKSRDWECESL